jgi:transcriptional regulator with XRE-family HTH domain
MTPYCAAMPAEKKDNRGAQLLRDLPTENGAVHRLAELCGVDHSVASRWRSGDRTPETRFRVRLQDEFGISLLAWDEPPLSDESPDTERAAS